MGRYLQRFGPDQLDTFAAALAELDLAVLDLAWDLDLDAGKAAAAEQGQIAHAAPMAQLERLRDRLLPFSSLLKQRRIDLLGHAHLDMAWLWPVAETWAAAERTFESALALQAEFPALTFGHSSPALYAWIQEHRPELFARIKAAIAQGRWEVIAGPWIEPDCILPSGESLVRQLLYGQRYVQQELGVDNRVAWLPDSFGFCNQLPQILKQAGVDYFVTEKLLWNDTTEFPHPLFSWRSPDGTEITSYMSARIGTQIDAVQMAEYGCAWEAATGEKRSLWLPGVGDHGGGPTREMLETAARWQESPFFPRMEFTTVQGYLDEVSDRSSPTPNSAPIPTPIPTWDRDLYLEYHRGCYTSHADQKRHNRQSEALLYEAELWSSLATLATAAPYPKAEIEALWKTVLFNQFHDILPGSSIPEVFADANRDWDAVFQGGDRLREAALGAIAQAIALPTPPQPDAVPLVIFNSLNWGLGGRRSPILPIDLPEAGDWQARDTNGQLLPSQPRSDHQLLVQAPSIPGVGYGLVWLCPVSAQAPGESVSQDGLDSPKSPSPPAPLPTVGEGSNSPKARAEVRSPVFPRGSKGLGDEGAAFQAELPTYQLENDHLHVTLDPQTGDLAQVFSKSLNRDLLSGPGNQLQAFRDQGQYWDAWNIDPDYAQHRLPDSDLISIEAIAQGPLEGRLRVVRRISQSICRQDYSLQRGSPLLRIETEIDWQEDHVLLKAAFPLALEADELITEVPHGIISRPTRPQTEAEKAQWEVPALRWAALNTPGTEPNPWGVSLLNDCKYGYDAGPSQLRL
ncbi:MAG: alpha-mannosidase, partial [Synechococcales cyanobacterium RM1_1_8]|nr:alpha-mannosidase [Synechococcales cyanobacterium RM1_1_8]